MLSNILIKDNGGHLRSRCFLLGNYGVGTFSCLCMNANPDGLRLTLNISQDDNNLDPELALMTGAVNNYLGYKNYFR